MTDARRLVDKLWSYCDVLRDDGVGVIEYTEQLTYLLFLKMAHERATRKLKPQQIVPEEYSWQKLLDAQGDQLELEYTRILNGLARQPGVIGTIFRKAQKVRRKSRSLAPCGSMNGWSWGWATSAPSQCANERRIKRFDYLAAPSLHRAACGQGRLLRTRQPRVVVVMVTATLPSGAAVIA